MGPLTTKAMQRLQFILQDNGLSPDNIKLLRSDERNVTLTGQMVITASLQIEQRRVAGQPKGKIDRQFNSQEDLDNYLKHHENEFRADPAWQEEVRKDLEKLPGRGWAAIVPQVKFDDRTQHLAAVEPCPSCAGRGAEPCEACSARGEMVCPHCRGQGTDICDWCQGSGYNLQDTSQLCNYCSGQRYTGCKYCRGQRTIPCPSCRGKRQIGCTSCQGYGVFSNTVTVLHVADMNFRAGTGQNVPVALRRLFDKQGGVGFLANGHAKISFNETSAKNSQQILLQYTAELPVAEITAQIYGKTCVMASFGLKNALLEVPPFLDKGLAPQMEHLKSLTQNMGDLSPMRRIRAFSHALDLALLGKKNPAELLRKVPIGLSPKQAAEMMKLSAKALARQNLILRYGAAIVVVLICLLLSGTFFAAVPLPTPWDWIMLALIVLAPLVLFPLGEGLALRTQHKGQHVKLRQPLTKFSAGVALACALLVGLSLFILPDPPKGFPRSAPKVAVPKPAIIENNIHMITPQLQVAPSAPAQ